MRRRSFSLIGLTCLATVLIASGCGRGTRLNRVTGTIKVNGSPLTNGSITFIPQGEGENAAAIIGPNGTYALSTNTGVGVRPGTYKVTISSYESPPQMNDPASGKRAIHSKYFSAETSGLTATVDDASRQVIDFDPVKN